MPSGHRQALQDGAALPVTVAVAVISGSFGHQLVYRSSTAGRSMAAATFISMPMAKNVTTRS